MKRKRYTTEQIIVILRQADTGKTVQEICRGNNVSEQTFYRWRKKYGNLELADAKRFDGLGITLYTLSDKSCGHSLSLTMEKPKLRIEKCIDHHIKIVIRNLNEYR